MFHLMDLLSRWAKPHARKFHATAQRRNEKSVQLCGDEILSQSLQFGNLYLPSFFLDIFGSWSFKARILKLELGNEQEGHCRPGMFHMGWLIAGGRHSNRDAGLQCQKW